MLAILFQTNLTGALRAELLNVGRASIPKRRSTPRYIDLPCRRRESLCPFCSSFFQCTAASRCEAGFFLNGTCSHENTDARPDEFFIIRDKDFSGLTYHRQC